MYRSDAIYDEIKNVIIDIYIDYGFGGSHFYELVKKGAKTGSPAIFRVRLRCNFFSFFYLF